MSLSGILRKLPLRLDRVFTAARPVKGVAALDFKQGKCLIEYDESAPRVPPRMTVHAGLDRAAQAPRSFGTRLHLRDKSPGGQVS